MSREQRIQWLRRRIRVGTDLSTVMANARTTNPNHPEVKRLQEHERDHLLGELLREVEEERQEKLARSS